METLDKVYNPRSVEPQVYAEWERSGAFRSKPDGRGHAQTFTIVMPPPNVTGALHLGHALNNTLQDILIRYHRMRGFNTLWQPGTDHAGIATQAVVERRIREQEGKTRHELGREELVRRIWQWKDEYERRIISQLKLMGCSADWERSRFTLDEGMSKAVRHMFFKLFKDGLIFRGKRLVNWDTQLQTAVSDDEVYYETVKGNFWHLRYPVVSEERDQGIERSRDQGTGLPPYQGGIEGGSSEPQFVIIATTRPETMLGDTAVAVHPDPEGFLNSEDAKLRESLTSAAGKDRADIEAKLAAIAERRQSHMPQLIKLRDMALAGRKLRLPLVEREIPLIADEWANPLLGSGCVKITPAHDPNDYNVGLRHKLPMINVLTPDGRVARILEADGSVNGHSADYEGLAFSSDGRRKVVADLEARGLIESIEDRVIELGHSDRSKLPIEPYLSDQWFVRTAGTERRDQGGDAFALVASPGSRDQGTKQSEPRAERSGLDMDHGLADAAMDVVRDGQIQVFPARYAKTYLDWLGEKRDWCISRQLWWGHRIPVSHTRLELNAENAWDEIVCRSLDHALLGENPNAIAIFVDPKTGAAIQTGIRRASIAEPPDGIPVYELDMGRFDTGELDGAHDVYVCDQGITDYWQEKGLAQDPDVLDTWFSSALWPFSTLGWPEETPHLKQYYPGSVLCTSRDIITNWVARMVMFGLYAFGRVPFDHVYVHPKILDGRGETMSKSKGNGVDPVDIIQTHGADALRYSMADLTTETQDIRMPVDYLCPHCGKLTDQSVALKAEEQYRKSRGEKLERKLQPADCTKVKCSHKECGKEFATQWAATDLKEKLGLGRETSEKFEIGRNFCNKLWNAARFAFMNLEGAPCNRLAVADLLPEDRWILARLSETIREYHRCLSEYQFAASVKALREFFWDSLCDWYLELTKPRFAADEGTQGRRDAGTKRTAQQVLAFCMDQCLRLWHPTIPFISEHLWAHLNQIAPRRGFPGIAELSTQGSLIAAAFPPVDGYPALDDDAILTVFGGLQDATRGVRELRTNCNVPPKDRVTATVVAPAAHIEAFRAQSHIVRHMAGIGELNVVSEGKRPANAASMSVGGLRIFVHGISDDKAERARAIKTLEGLDKQIAGKESKLGNAQFVANADPAVVAAERERLAELADQRDTLRTHLAELDG